MPDILLSYEPQLRLLAFVGVFAIMATWEFLAPRRRRTIGRSARWPGNLVVVAIDTLLVLSPSNIEILKTRFEELPQLFSDALKEIQRVKPVPRVYQWAFWRFPLR